MGMINKIIKKIYGEEKTTQKFGMLFFIAISIAVVGILLEISEAYFVKKIVDHALESSISDLTFYILVMIIVVIIGFFSSYLLKKQFGKHSSQIGYEIKKKSLQKIVNLPIATYEKLQTGDWLIRLNEDIGTIVKFFTADLLDLLVQIMVFVGGSIFLSFLSFRLYLACILLFPICFLVLNYTGNYEKKYYKEFLEGLSKCGISIQDTIKGIDVIKSYNYEEKLYEKYQGQLNEVYKSLLKSIKYITYTYPLSIILKVFPFVTCIFFGGYLTLREIMSPGDLLAFIMLLDYVLSPLSKINNFILVFKRLEVANTRLSIIFDEDLEEDVHIKLSPKSEEDVVRDSEACIEFKNVDFSYNTKEKTIKNVSFKIKRGDTVAFIGGSGSGKSTILKLISGFYDSFDGDIRVLGKSLRNPSNDALNEVSFVMQDTNLYTATIYENILCGNFEAELKNVIDVAEKACAHEFISQLPEGYETFIGENGVKLSGGQRQRIAYARGLLKDSPILLLDEATSSLDAESEYYMLETLKNVEKDKTVVIVAHNSYTIKNVDFIYVMDQGEIIASGTHGDLFEKNRFYTSFYNQQLLPESR